MYVDSVTALAIADSSYHAWDSLNGALQCDSVWNTLWVDEFRIYVFRLRFRGLKNPSILADSYAALPGIAFTATTGERFGDPPGNVWPYVDHDTVTYLFFRGWGDCPSGCVNKQFYYVVAAPDSVWFVGTWLRVSSGGSEPLPPWWPQACENLQRTWLQFLCD
jgi:hypothetical protein